LHSDSTSLVVIIVCYRQGKNIVGSLLYYARTIDSAILPAALNDIGAQQSQATKYTLQRCNMLLDYVVTYQNAKIRIHACDMQLYVDSDAAYFVQPQVFYLGSPQSTHYILNGAVLVTCKQFVRNSWNSSQCSTCNCN